MGSPDGRAVLTPAQERTLKMVRREGEPVVFDAELVDELSTTAADALQALAEQLVESPAHPLVVTKHALGTVLDCEAQYLMPEEFSWSVPVARGKVAHRAIQLLLHWHAEAIPAGLVDEAIARLEDEEHGLGDWLVQLGPAQRADLRGQCVDLICKFMESFPPLDPRSRPVTESATQWPVDGPILLRGRADLSIGAPAGRESRKLIVDFKSGRAVARHREDLRFYALVETLSRQVPPRRLASMYLDAAEPMVEDVTVGTLRSALRRTLDGVGRIVELRAGSRSPAKTPGPFCRWCAGLADCDEGQEHLAERDADAF